MVSICLCSRLLSTLLSNKLGWTFLPCFERYNLHCHIFNASLHSVTTLSLSFSLSPDDVSVKCSVDSIASSCRFLISTTQILFVPGNGLHG
jgi:hypothetical protein